MVMLSKAMQRKRAQECTATWKDSKMGLNHEQNALFLCQIPVWVLKNGADNSKKPIPWFAP